MIRAAAVLLLWPALASAQALTLPGNATVTLEDPAAPGTLALPTAPWRDGVLPSVALDGTLTRQAYRIDAADLATLTLLRPLREQLRDAGYEILLDCDTEACGGFDFRFAIDVALPPGMEVNLGDFRFLSARRDDAGVTLLVSTTATAGHLQITRIGPEPAPDPIRAAALTTRAAPGDLANTLEATGRAILSDLTFETGSATLGPGPFDSLADLAALLAADPDLRVALVGHTDSSGTLAANIALSKRRAGAVLERLATAHAAPRARMEAEGMGYLAPVASNRSEEGREANRRVEVIVTSTR